MARFRKYLDNRGSSFSQSRDLLSYFALPFVPDLRHHDEFKQLFKVIKPINNFYNILEVFICHSWFTCHLKFLQPEWSTNLRIKLENFLQQILKVSNDPKLVTLFVSFYLFIKICIHLNNYNNYIVLKSWWYCS